MNRDIMRLFCWKLCIIHLGESGKILAWDNATNRLKANKTVKMAQQQTNKKTNLKLYM